MKNIKGWEQMLNESSIAEEQPGGRIWIAFAGDDNIFAVGFYGTREEAEKAIEERYDASRKSAKMEAEDPHVFSVDSKDPKRIRELIGYSIDALEAYEPEARDFDEEEKIVYLLRRLVSLGISLDDIVGFEHMRNFANKKRIWDLDKLFKIGLFDGDLDWMPEGPMKDKIRRIQQEEDLFGSDF